MCNLFLTAMRNNKTDIATDEFNVCGIELGGSKTKPLSLLCRLKPNQKSSKFHLWFLISRFQETIIKTLYADDYGDEIILSSAHDIHSTWNFKVLGGGGKGKGGGGL